MDSMRHLSTSLPRERNEPPNDLLVDFKAAAMSVTSLYRTAVAAQKQARAAGYQDACHDLLHFLDTEKLGLVGGEGWRVRQYATERLDGEGVQRQTTSTGPTLTDEEDEDASASLKEEDKDDTRSLSPEMQRRPQSVPASTSSLTDEDALTNRPAVSESPQPTLPQHPVPQSDFTFQSTHTYPHSNHDRGTNGEMDMDCSSTPTLHTVTSSTPSSAETVRIIPRSNRSARHMNHNRRTGNDNRTPSINFNLGSGAGSKRRMPYPDFFDISGINDGGDRKDSGGTGRGGKRRHL